MATNNNHINTSHRRMLNLIVVTPFAKALTSAQSILQPTNQPPNDQLRIDQLQNFIDIQGSDGNWNYNEYMHGLYNGLELALAVLENRGPRFKAQPEQWVGYRD